MNKYNKEVESFAHRYGCSIRKRQNIEVYEISSFPEPLPCQVSDFIKARFKVNDKDNHSINFII